MPFFTIFLLQNKNYCFSWYYSNFTQNCTILWAFFNFLRIFTDFFSLIFHCKYFLFYLITNNSSLESYRVIISALQVEIKVGLLLLPLAKTTIPYSSLKTVPCPTVCPPALILTFVVPTGR